MKQQRPKSHYTLEFEEQTVQLANAIDHRKAADQLDIPLGTLENWLAVSQAGKPLSTAHRTCYSTARQ